MPFHVTKATSIVVASGNAFGHAGPDSVLVDAGAFVISDNNGDGMTLTDEWNITINGIVAAFGGIDQGIQLISITAGLFSNVVVGAQGSVFGESGAIFAGHAINLVNRGTISSPTSAVVVFSLEDSTVTNFGLMSAGGNALAFTSGGVHTVVNFGTISGGNGSIVNSGVSGIEHVTNSGHLIGDVELGGNADVFTDFTKKHGLIKSGTVSGIVSLGEGNDIFNGGNASETVKDDPGADTVKLGGGNDIYLAVTGGGAQDLTDTIDGGKGIDAYDANDAIAPVLLDFSLQVVFGTDITDGLQDNVTGFENAIGGSAGDVFVGSSGANRFEGRDGDDTLGGAGGNDFLIGGIGLDTLIGGAGKDTLTGGEDADTFRFLFLADSGKTAKTRDTITDFSRSDGDKIDLQLIDADPFTALDQPFHLTGNFGLDGFTQAPGELRFVMSKSATLVQGDVNGDGKADFSILLQGNVHPLAADFTL